MQTEPSPLEAGVPARLTLQIQEESGSPITRFDVVHEELVHLIIVREGLDEFAHLHPWLDESGKLTQEHTFPKSGTYRLFDDYKPSGRPPELAAAEVNVPGPVEPGPELVLVPDAPGAISVGELTVHVTLNAQDGETTITFHFVDGAGKSIADLQPYLGAMGHLVVINADGREYVHAHPLNESVWASDGTVEFAASFRKPGLYKAWGQFRRNGSVVTVPFVMSTAREGNARGARKNEQ